MKTTSGLSIFGFQDKPFDIFVILLATISYARTQTCVEQFLFRNVLVLLCGALQQGIRIEQLDWYLVSGDAQH